MAFRMHWRRMGRIVPMLLVLAAVAGCTPGGTAKSPQEMDDAELGAYIEEKLEAIEDIDPDDTEALSGALGLGEAPSGSTAPDAGEGPGTDGSAAPDAGPGDADAGSSPGTGAGPGAGEVAPVDGQAAASDPAGAPDGAADGTAKEIDRKAIEKVVFPLGYCLFESVGENLTEDFDYAKGVAPETLMYYVTGYSIRDIARIGVHDGVECAFITEDEMAAYVRTMYPDAGGIVVGDSDPRLVHDAAGGEYRCAVGDGAPMRPLVMDAAWRPDGLSAHVYIIGGDDEVFGDLEAVLVENDDPVAASKGFMYKLASYKVCRMAGTSIWKEVTDAELDAVWAALREEDAQGR